MAYNIWSRQRPKRTRLACTETFTDTETGGEVTLTMWRPTNPETGQAMIEGDRLIEKYIDGIPEENTPPLPFDGVGGVYITFKPEEKEENPDAVLLNATVLKNGSLLEAMQPPFAEERYTAEEFAAMFATWLEEDWGKLWLWTQGVAKGTKQPPKN